MRNKADNSQNVREDVLSERGITTFFQGFKVAKVTLKTFSAPHFVMISKLQQ